MTTRRKYVALVFAGILAAVISQTAVSQSGGGGQQGNAGASALQDRTSSSPGEALYVEKCSMCHRQFGMGTVLLSRRLPPAQAQLEDRENLPANYVMVAARQGIGNMPRIPRGEVSDEQLRQIADYLAQAEQ